MKNILMRNKRINRAFALFLAVILMFSCTLAANAEEVEEREMSKPGDSYTFDTFNPFVIGFSVATQVYSVNGEYFIADAYNNQILYTNNYRNASADWNLMGNRLFRPHAIASDGTIYMAVDTDNHRVVTYAKTDQGFQVIECFENVGVRPHYVEYDASTGQFYVWSSMTGTMYIYERSFDGLNVTLTKTAYIEDLDGYYTRSFTIDGDKIYLPSMGRNAIYVVSKSDFNVQNIYPVSEELGGMVQVRHEQNYYYLVTSTDAYGDHRKAAFVRSSSLAGFVEGSYENLRDLFPEIEGIPYYITYLEDGHYYTPLTLGYSPSYICRFDIENDQITNIVNYKCG